MHFGIENGISIQVSLGHVYETKTTTLKLRGCQIRKTNLCAMGNGGLRFGILDRIRNKKSSCSWEEGAGQEARGEQKAQEAGSLPGPC